MALSLSCALGASLLAQAEQAQEEPARSAGVDDLDSAMRMRATAKDLRSLSRIVELLESALDKGLDPEAVSLARIMLSDARMERATTLVRAVNARSILDPRVQKIRQMVVSDLRRVLDLDDPPAKANYLLGRMMAMRGGDLHEANRALTKFLKSDDVSDPQRAEALVLRASLRSDEAKSLADIDKAIELAPEKTDYRLARAVFLQGRKRTDEALADIRATLELSPDDANALILQGKLLHQLGQMEDAITSFDEATRLAPQAPGPYQYRGEIYRHLGKFEKAVDQFSMVLKLQPGVLLTLVHRAEVYLAAGRNEEALADIEIVLEKQNNLVDAHKIRAAALVKLNRLDKAIREMEQVAEAAPDQRDLKMKLAMYYLIQKKPLRAIGAYDAVLTINGKDVVALRSRGDIYLGLGQHEKAISDFKAALKQNPKDVAVLNNLAWVLATSPENEIRNGRRALELAIKACELTKYKMPHILSTLAACYAETGDFESAIKWSQKSVDIGSEEHGSQLSKELSSYRQQKPWRENQVSQSRPSVKEENPKPQSEEPQSEEPQSEETIEATEF